MQETALVCGRSVERPHKRLKINQFYGRSTERPYCLMEPG